MSPAASITTCLRKYATFSGRASRSEFWWFFGLCAVIVAFLRLVDLEAFFVFVVLFPIFAVACRRFHDIDRGSSWGIVVLPPLLYTLLPPGPPGISVVIGSSVELPGWAMSIAVAVVMACNVVIVTNLFREGTAGPNRFGIPPVDSGLSAGTDQLIDTPRAGEVE